MEHIEWNRIRFDLAKRQGEIDQVFVAFSHADNAARADFESGRPGMANCGQPVLKGVGAADFGVIGLARIQVVIDPVHAGGFEVLRLAFVEQSERATDLDGDFLFDGSDGRGNIGFARR